MKHGIAGTYGPNDGGYLCLGVREAAKTLVSCSKLWSEGHYPHSNAKAMPSHHPIARALATLAELDMQICHYANLPHSPELFEPYIPSREAQHRWNKGIREFGDDTDAR